MGKLGEPQQILIHDLMAHAALINSLISSFKQLLNVKEMDLQLHTPLTTTESLCVLHDCILLLVAKHAFTY